MKTPTNPTSLMLVGVLFIYIILTPATALQQPSGLEQLNKLKDQYQNSPDLGMLKVGAETIIILQNKGLPYHIISPEEKLRSVILNACWEWASISRRGRKQRRR